MDARYASAPRPVVGSHPSYRDIRTCPLADSSLSFPLSRDSRTNILKSPIFPTGIYTGGTQQVPAAAPVGWTENLTATAFRSRSN